MPLEEQYMSVYRMIFAPDVTVSGYTKGDDKYDECRAAIFHKFLEYGFLGTGWDTSCLQPKMTDEEIRAAMGVPKGSIGNFRCMCNMSKDDLVWIIFQSNYYLFRISENKLGTSWLRDRFEDQEQWFLDRDISTCFTGEWCKVGNEMSVPGVIINNMSIGPTLREIKRAPELSMMVWNRCTDSNYYCLKGMTEEWFWDQLTDRQIEGLVLSYLQVTYDCIVNTESLKHSTALYECELIGKDGTRYLPQVKSGSSGNKEFPVEQFCRKIDEIGSQTRFPVVPILFYENEDYGDYEHPRLIKLTKTDLTGFIRNNPQYISSNIKNAFNMIVS